MTRTKILYVNPGKLNSGLDYMIKGPPLALLSIAAMMPEKEYEATLYDFKVEDYKEEAFIKLLQEQDIVAISSMTPQINHALEVAQMAKMQGTTTILGGYHPTLDPKSVIEHEFVDFVVRGEGEHTFKELVEYLNGNPTKLEKSQIKGISYHDGNGNIVHNEDRPLEENLDNLPIPRRDLLNRTKYNYMGARVMLMETSRGCPHNCKFCCIVKMWNDPTGKIRYRAKSVKRIMQEIYSIDTEYWDFIFFNDDNFTIDVKRTRKILEAIVRSKVNQCVNFSCQTRVDTLTRNPWLAPLMKKAQMTMAFLGIESVHQQSLDGMNKHTNADMIQEAVNMCHDNGIVVFGGMIIGFPGETKEMVRENIDFAISLGLEFVQFTPITAFPGTPFFEEMDKNGKVATYNYKYYNLFHPMMRTEELGFVEMYRLVAEAYAKYYNNARYLGMMIKKALSEEFRWFLPISLRWFRQFALGGLGMLHQNGITIDLARQAEKKEGKMKKTLNKWRLAVLSRRKRYKLFKMNLKRLLEQMRAQGKDFFQIRSKKLKVFIVEQGLQKFI